MKTNRTRMIGSAIAGTGVAALVVAGMAFGMPSFDDDTDPMLGDSARARQQLQQQQGSATLKAPSDPNRAKTGERILPAQAAGAEETAVVAEQAAAAPIVTPAAAEEPASQPSPVAEGQGSWGDEEQAERGDDEYDGAAFEHEEHEAGDDD